jgi:MFS family permease
MTIIGDLYSAQERGRVQGWLASVWGVSSVVGPLAGGFIIQHASWAWVFWINLPIGLASSFGFWRFLREDVARTTRSVDVVGAALFTICVAALMLALTEAGTENVTTGLAAAAVCVVAASVFVWQELRARDPMVAFGLWAKRQVATANAATLLSGMTIIGLTTFLPMYVQGVLGQSAIVAGFALTMVVLGWPIGATLAARNFKRYGLRGTLLTGAVLMPLGAIPFLFLEPGVSAVVAGGGSIVIGLGMGFLSTTAIVIIQDSVGWAERGAATASNIFSRNLGSTLGATVLGAVLNYTLSHQQTGATKVGFGQIRDLLDNPGLVADDGVRAVLGSALHVTFWGIMVIALATLAVSLLVPAVKMTSVKPSLLVE